MRSVEILESTLLVISHFKNCCYLFSTWHKFGFRSAIFGTSWIITLEDLKPDMYISGTFPSAKNIPLPPVPNSGISKPEANKLTPLAFAYPCWILNAGMEMWNYCVQPKRRIFTFQKWQLWKPSRWVYNIGNWLISQHFYCWIFEHNIEANEHTEGYPKICRKRR